MEADQTVISNILSLTLIIVTVIYVIFTGKIAANNRKMLRMVSDQHLETVRPYVIVRLETYEGVVFSLEIENTGKTSARDLKLTIDKDFHPFGNRESIRNFNIFKNPISTFSPGEKVTILLSQGFNMENFENGINLTPETFSVKAEYKDRANNYSDNFVIETNTYYSTTSIKKTQEHLKSISDHLKKISEKYK